MKIEVNPEPQSPSLTKPVGTDLNRASRIEALRQRIVESGIPLLDDEELRHEMMDRKAGRD